jgi:predicted enzyme related to lactoylglutathione lyase
MSRVIHFEIHASKPQALIAFYASLFGWKFQQWGEIEYWQVETGPSDQAGINGGLVLRRTASPLDGQVGWLAYVKDPDANILGLMQPDPSAK